MKILGIETSCDECSVSIVEDGKKILSNVVATQIELHKPWYGVVPEIASRLHTEWISPVTDKALNEAGLKLSDIDGIAVTSMPGLIGSLMVGLSYAKGLSWAAGIPLIQINHIEAHLYAPHLEFDIQYPYLGLIVSGGHTLLCHVTDYNKMEVLGTTIDDACGEAFDKVAKYYDLGYPGGVAIDKLSSKGNPLAFRFPKPNLYKGDHKYDFSYSGLKTAVINQIEQFIVDEKTDKSVENIAASFQKTAIDMLINKTKKLIEDSGIKRVVAGGGVSANSYFRKALSELKGIESYFPSLKLCTDNGAMIAGLGYHHLKAGDRSPLNGSVFSRVQAFKKKYP